MYSINTFLFKANSIHKYLILNFSFLCDYTTHNYIIKYLIFCMESVFCDKINGTQFYRDQ
ncbi:hypothetical protein FFZ99_11255 [Leptospira interrogans]|uniref:Uncharacterized protein n=2 Tax=Leptospira interrogans TaxID=173 RepID=A0AAQ0B0J3_LEPIR|nr:hypothetical protein A6J42_07130 [Leptospira interrogans serovar Copenhageni]ASP42637.1 hypothetical protein AMR47_17155 [Leptospira interrogans]ASV05536.1 hypothetical protein B2G47_05055 [Leptospira interrogans serovar Canicola]KAA1291465.1 hypothetical protein C4X99_14895 [Leptospira interrogans serovar Geyaweera]MBE0302531.1 hypothetical protein [Leptospira interrogans serovar Yeoncheon]OMH68919.1 hypothetical protein BW243_05420 [Leptospira interrogans serovar Pomona]OOB96201.1 hypoth